MSGARPAIGEREIHIWIARTDRGDAEIASLSRVLDGEERSRAARFHFDADRRRSIVARGALRLLLAQYLARDPSGLRFVTGPQGKPSLADAALEVNVSHSGDYVLIALASGTPLGVDVECENRTTDLKGIADRFFDPAEAAAVVAANDADAVALFFQTWTAKEALIKAVGGGLSLPLDSFRVRPGSEQFAAVQNHGHDERLDGWYVRALPPFAVHYHAAVAARGDAWETIIRPFQP
jgi:4'-phosphopantetheinyl transferase